MSVLTRIGGAFARSFISKPQQPARRSYEAAHGRPWSNAPGFARHSAETLAAAGPLRLRARRAYANNPHARAAVEAWVTALVGTGARATPRNADARVEIVSAIDRWADVAVLDGTTDWYGLQAEMVRAMVIDGEALLLLIDTPEGLRLRLLPAEMLDESGDRDLGTGGQIVGGIEFDAAGRRVAYHLRRDNPASPWAAWTPPQRVSADDVIHLFRPLGAGQVRGVSWLAPVQLPLGEVDKLRDAAVAAAQVSAMLCGFIKTNDPDGEEPFDLEIETLVPGTLKRLSAGVDVTWSSPPAAQNVPQIMSAELRAIAVGMGVPAHLVSGDLSQANYSSLRADLVSFRQRYEQVQYHTLGPQLLRRVYARAVASLTLAGDLPSLPFDRDWAADWIFPAPPWIDPAKDAAAYRELIDAGLMSRRQAVAERGWNVADVDAEIAEDRAREQSLGLNFGRPVTTQPKESADD